MKRLILRFQNFNNAILASAFLSAISAVATGFTFSLKEIAAGIVFAVVAALAFIVLIWYVSRAGVIIDFRHNKLKMKSNENRAKCKIDEIIKMEIVFHWVDKMQCYSAQITVNLNNGNSMAVKFNPHIRRYRFGYYLTGAVTNKKRQRIISKVSGYDFIVCRTIK